MPRSRIRLLFDELLPHPVARALRELGFHTSHVGSEIDRTPPRGSSDEVVLDFAMKTNQTVVTSNHDMILLCEEKNESVIWIDPFGKKLRRNEFAVICFQGIPEWEARPEAATGPTCVRVLRTKIETMTMEEGARRSRERLRRIEAKERRRKHAPRPEASPPLPGLDD